MLAHADTWFLAPSFLGSRGWRPFKPWTVADRPWGQIAQRYPIAGVRCCCTTANWMPVGVFSA